MANNKFNISTNIEAKAVKDFEKLLGNIKDLYTKDELEQIKLAYDMMKSSNRDKAKLIRPIVPIEEWLEDPYYIGPDYESIYPFWKNEIIKIVSSKDVVNQVILSGAIGTGKSTTAVLLIIRKLYELSCYENISALFNLFGVSRIAFAYLSVTREQAQNTGFALLVEWLDSIPYFSKEFKRKDRLDSMVIWPQEKLIVMFGSVANHFIGMNLLGSILDEANFFSGRSKEESNYTMNSKVASLYTQIITRSESRFIINGVNHSLSILVSSSTVASSFTEERIEKAKNDPHTVVISPALWDVKPWNYGGEKFYVYAGGDNIDPFVIEDLDDFNMLLTNKQRETLSNITLKAAYKSLPVEIKSNILTVPIEHKQSFQGDIIIALQDIAGYSVSAANRLFSSETAYNTCISSSSEHPFSREQFVLSTTKKPLHEGFLPIKSYLYNGIKFDRPDMKRFIHLDLALTGDSLGIAMCYISGWKSIYKQESNKDKLDEEYDEESGVAEDEIKIPIISYDFMLRINPPKKPNKISLGKVRDFIVYLRSEHKIKFGMITADQFQSAQLLQELDELNFPTGQLSVDRTPDAYITFTNLIYEERVNFYNYEPFKKELFSVIYYPARKKVDHITGGSKDVADAVVGSAFNAIKSLDKNDMTEQSLSNLFMISNYHEEEESKNIIEDAINKLTDILTRS